MVLRGYGRGRWWARAGALVGALTACAWLAAPPAPLRTEAHFPHVAPRSLAHTLADFTNHPYLYPHLGSWTVEAESGNYSAWRYEVSYTCGPRCRGRATLLALDPPPSPPHRPAHPSPARTYTVIVSHRSCTSPAVLPWTQFCEEWETETAVGDDGGGGAVFAEVARGGCGAGAGPVGALRRLLSALGPTGRSCGQQLRDARQEHLRRLRALLQQPL